MEEDKTLTELLSELSLTQVIIIIFMIAIAAKELITLIDFFVKKAKTSFNKEQEKKDEKQNILEEINKIHASILKNEEEHKTITSQILEIKEENKKMFTQQQTALNMLVASDIDDIKSYIVKQYHTFHAQGWIDDFSMDAIEKRFQHYINEGGNSYVHNLVEKLRQLPNHPPK